MALDRIRIPLKDGSILIVIPSQFQPPPENSTQKSWVFYISTGTSMSHDITRVGVDTPKHYRLTTVTGFEPLPLGIIYEVQKRMREVSRDTELRLIQAPLPR